MRFVTAVKSLWLVCILAVLNVAVVCAQTGAQIVVGENYSLGVIEVPGESYDWTIYSDYTLSVQATPDEVRWLSSRTGPSVRLEWMKSGVYYFTVMAINPNGCMNLKVGMVVVNQSAGLTPGIVIQPDKNPVCEGTGVSFSANVVNQGMYPIYHWRKNGVLVGMNSSRYYDKHLKHGDKLTCQLTSSAKLANPVNVGSNEVTMVVYKTKASFRIAENIYDRTWQLHLINQSRDAETYNWDFGDGQTSGEENPVVTYKSDGTFLIRLIASNQYNCIDTAYYMYEMLFKGLYIPNAFAPTTSVSTANLFKPHGTNLKEYRIEVYDSWGHLLWESEKLDESGTPVEAWDGTYKGKLMPQGTYMWKVNAIFRDGSVWTGSDIGHGKGKTMGTVTLIR
jgi:gliding motility-associated-like protein